jgi:hypothetical protein
MRVVSRLAGARTSTGVTTVVSRLAGARTSTGVTTVVEV